MLPESDSELLALALRFVDEIVAKRFGQIDLIGFANQLGIHVQTMSPVCLVVT